MQQIVDRTKIVCTTSRSSTSYLVIYLQQTIRSVSNVFLNISALKIVVYYSLSDLESLDVDNFQLANEGTFSGLQAYKNTKLCNLLTTYRLAEKLLGQKVTVNAVDPGNFENDFVTFDKFIHLRHLVRLFELLEKF